MAEIAISIINRLDDKGYLIIKREEYNKLRKTAQLCPEVSAFARSINSKIDFLESLKLLKFIDEVVLMGFIEDDIIKLLADLRKNQMKG